MILRPASSDIRRQNDDVLLFCTWPSPVPEPNCRCLPCVLEHIFVETALKQVPRGFTSRIEVEFEEEEESEFRL
jgi:hypothetical protein